MLTNTQAETISKARKALLLIDVFRTLNAEMQAQQMQVFLAVAANPDRTLTDICNLTGHPSSTVSRNVAALGKTHRGGQPGLELVSAIEDPTDRRHKRLRLTPKGQLVMNAIGALL
jgi:DNA-binding MarR family transcriptional regulator